MAGKTQLLKTPYFDRYNATVDSHQNDGWKLDLWVGCRKPKLTLDERNGLFAPIDIARLQD
jgi:hypothetical protein